MQPDMKVPLLWAVLSLWIGACRVHPNRKWAHTLHWDPAKLQQNPPVYNPVTSTMPPRFPPSYGERNQVNPSGPGQKIYVGNFPFGSWELSSVQNGNTYTVGESKAVVPRADSSHLIYDDPPSNGVFPYLKKRDLDSSEDPKDDNLLQY